MKKLSFRRLMPAALAVFAAMVMGGCSAAPSEKEEVQETGPQLYYLNEAENGLLTAFSDTPNTGDDAIRDLFKTLKNGEFSDGHSAVPESLELERTAWQENRVVLYLKGRYPEVGTPEETFCRAALVLTMLSASDADSVVINVNNNPLTDESGREVGAIRRSDFMLSLTDKVEEGEDVTLTLYFANGDGTALVREEAETTLEEGDLTESAVMDLLISGPKEAGHLAVMPAGAGVLGVSVKDRICYVNLNEAFLNPVLDVSDELMIYAIVNSLTELQEVDKVQITVNGSADISYDGSLSVSSPLAPKDSLIGE